MVLFNEFDCLFFGSFYRENSIASLEQGILPIITAAMTSSNNAEDCFSLGCKVIWGISEALKDESMVNQTLLDKFAEGDAVKALLCVVKSGAAGDDVLSLVFRSLQNIGSLLIESDSAVSSSKELSN